VICALNVLNPAVLMIDESLHVFIEIAMSILLTQTFHLERLQWSFSILTKSPRRNVHLVFEVMHLKRELFIELWLRLLIRPDEMLTELFIKAPVQYVYQAS
jgi:predicted DNA-binding transcriptional regulator